MPVRTKHGRNYYTHYAHPLEIRRKKGLHRKAWLVLSDMFRFARDNLSRNPERHLKNYPVIPKEELGRKE